MDVIITQRIIAVIGPESTGKTTLAGQLAAYFNADLVPEFAREYLEKLDRPYQEHDLLTIAQGQFTLEQQVIANGNTTIICDTDLLVLQVWSEVRYATTSTSIKELIRLQPKRFYILTRPDLPWEPDPLREHPNSRDQLFDGYERLLTASNLPFAIVDGTGENRLNNALIAINKASI